MSNQSSEDFNKNVYEVAAEYNPFFKIDSSARGTLLSEFISPTQNDNSESMSIAMADIEESSTKKNTILAVFDTAKNPAKENTSTLK